MSNKTEQPTPKKLKDAVKKGQVAFSKDANNVLTYILGLAMIFLMAKAISAGFAEYYKETIQLIADDPMNPEVWNETASRALSLTFRLVAPIIFSITIFGVALNYGQVGVIFAFDSIKPKIEKLNPIAQLKNIFSVKGLFEFAKTLLKLGFVFLLGYVTVKGSLGDLLRLSLAPGEAVVPQGAQVARHFLTTIAIVFVGLGALDFAFQRWQWKKGLMMTKDEVKREYKESEGDPEIKAERKAIHQEIVNQDVSQGVARADAVVVNPTHLAIAIEYKKGITPAPKVTIKGRAHLAKKIIKLAKKRDIPIIRDITLAHALIDTKVDHYVPKELYEAVAEVLLFAWKIRRETGDGYGV